MSNKTNTKAESNVAEVVIPTLADYQNADKDGKAAIRKAVQALRDEAIDNLDLDTAKAAKAALESYVPAKAAKVETDWNRVLFRRVRVLEEAATMLRHGNLPDGFPEDFVYVDEASIEFSDEERAEIVSDAVKVATAKLTRSGKRNDVGARLTEVLSGIESGTFLKVSEVANMCRQPGDTSWNGRISAHLFPKDEAPRQTDRYTAVPRTATTPDGLTVN
jgi:hypothetical protein